MKPFVSFGTSHFLGILLLIIVGSLSYIIGKRVYAGKVSAEKVKYILGGGVLLNIVLVYAYEVLFNFDWAATMPFQICDWAWMASAIVLFYPAKNLKDCLFYWGLSFNIIAILTPVIPYDFPSSRFIVFWLCHGGILCVSLYLISAYKHVPDFKDMFRVFGITVTGTFLVMGFNFWAGTNYIFVNRKPPGPTPLDHLAPWPYYIIQELILVLIVWSAMTLIGKRLKGNEE